MKNALLLLYLSFLIFSGCKQTIDTTQLDALNAELTETKTALENAKSELASLKVSTGKLVHLVYFNLKAEISAEDKAKFIAEIEKLENIEVLQNLEVGEFKNLNDQRALSEYEILMSMEFESELDYQTYQAHEIHQNLKKVAGNFLAAPPVTYDYILN